MVTKSKGSCITVQVQYWANFSKSCHHVHWCHQWFNCLMFDPLMVLLLYDLVVTDIQPSRPFSIPFHWCWFDLFANTVPGWGTLYSVYFLLLDVEEFVFSSWYFLIFYIINSSRGSLPIDVSSLTLEIANGLADKLSVPPSVFIVNNVHKANLW